MLPQPCYYLICLLVYRHKLTLMLSLSLCFCFPLLDAIYRFILCHERVISIIPIYSFAAHLHTRLLGSNLSLYHLPKPLHARSFWLCASFSSWWQCARARSQQQRRVFFAPFPLSLSLYINYYLSATTTTTSTITARSQAAQPSTCAPPSLVACANFACTVERSASLSSCRCRCCHTLPPKLESPNSYHLKVKPFLRQHHSTKREVSRGVVWWRFIQAQE